MPDGRPARDRALLDSIDSMPRHRHVGDVWRVCRAGRDPDLGATSRSRWCDGSFDVLYTSLERDGAIAEVHAYLALQPVFPSKLRVHAHRLAVDARGVLDLRDDTALSQLGIARERYQERRYDTTASVAEAANFLGFAGVLAPSARWPCANLILFSDRQQPGAVRLVESDPQPVNFRSWRRSRTP